MKVVGRAKHTCRLARDHLTNHDSIRAMRGDGREGGGEGGEGAPIMLRAGVCVCVCVCVRARAQANLR